MDMTRMRQLAGVTHALPGLSESLVAKTILQQMGGPGRLSVMLGTKHFTSYGNGVSFKWPNRERSRGNVCKITLRPDDTYDMEFFNNAKSVKKYEGIYNDQLVSTFEKQTGWFLSLGGGKKPFGSGTKPGPEMPPIGTKHEALIDDINALLEGSAVTDKGALWSYFKKMGMSDLANPPLNVHGFKSKAQQIGGRSYETVFIDWVSSKARATGEKALRKAGFSVDYGVPDSSPTSHVQFGGKSKG